MISISFHLFPFHKGLSRSLSSTIIKYTYIHPAAKEGHPLFAIDYENQQKIIYTFSLLYLKTGLYICTYTICILLHIPKLWLNVIQWFPINYVKQTMVRFYFVQNVEELVKGPNIYVVEYIPMYTFRSCQKRKRFILYTSFYDICGGILASKRVAQQADNL